MKLINKNQAGFSYIDVMAAIIIMSVGMIAMTQAIMFSLMRSRESEEKLFAKQIAQSTLESIFAARDIKRTGGVDGWGAVGNVGRNPASTPPFTAQGIFVNDWHPVREQAGHDGVIGTRDDSCLGTGACPSNGLPNTSPVMPGYERRIVIEDVEDPERPSPEYSIMRRRVTIVVRYAVGGIYREEQIRTMISSFESI